MAGHVDVRYTSERCYIQGQKLNIWGEERLYKILIVEDDETIAGGLKNHLGKWNYQAECMTDFKDVMGKFVDFEPQLVLLDIVLPFFNGFHWCQEIRKIVSRESIMTRLWDSNEFIDDNTLTVNVARLRKKMEQIGLGGKIITKKGIGYMVEA